MHVSNEEPKRQGLVMRGAVNDPTHLVIRDDSGGDEESVWRILASIIAEGDAYALDPATTRDEGLAFWYQPGARRYIAESGERIVGAYFLRPNQPGRGSHVANAAYLVATEARGKGVGRAMGEHSIREARELGYRAMQFNFVVSTNVAAVRLWSDLGFLTVATLPGAFRHPTLGFVDALVMFRLLNA
jgi:L-amino acid N-acyltransferase YncA